MSQIRYPHAATKRLAELEPLNSPKLHDRIYDLLVAGQFFTPDRLDEFQDNIALLATLQEIAADYTWEAGPFGDLFGEYLEAIGETSERTGQFFTPPDLVDLTTRITLEDLDLGGRPKMIADPASGTGRFMLGVAKHFAEQNDGCLNFLCVNIDIDRKAFAYCVMNAVLHGIPSVCIHGDTLKVEAWNAFATIPMFGGYARWERVRLDVAKNLIFSAKEIPQPVPADVKVAPVPSAS